MKDTAKKSIRSLAFYLPQFHPTPENDAWWGKGFTEWTNVTKAKPLFSGHYQPHLPSDLGIYDLRVPETRAAQAQLAAEYGIYGFCYYHYWFNGKRLLDRPLNEVLASGQPDFPFCLCWANENWTRTWDGLDSELLIGQKYCEEDDRQHIRWLIDVFRDRRYIRVDGRPLLLVYRSRQLPDPLATTTIWREEARRAGIGELYLCRVESFNNERDDPTALGFDAAVEFQPDWIKLGLPVHIQQQQRSKLIRLQNKLGFTNLDANREGIYDYPSLVREALGKAAPLYTRFPCVTPSWDNSARRKLKPIILKNATPEVYGKWLKGALDNFTPPSEEENFVFINAWNEWGEGNHLEPCRKWGRAYLEATREALSQYR